MFVLGSRDHHDRDAARAGLQPAGVIWAVIAVICAVGAVLEWTIGLHAAAVLCLVIAIGSGWYDYRVWTFKTRRLIL